MVNQTPPSNKMEDDSESDTRRSEDPGRDDMDADDLAEGFAGGEESDRWQRIEAGVEELTARIGEVQTALQSLAGDMMAAGKETAASMDDSVRRSIERQPYTAVILAAFIGFILGSMNSRDGD
jgi:ElaB/YqjD/DUF883 family membrane-anchored ribosome-binding protein